MTTCPSDGEVSGPERPVLFCRGGLTLAASVEFPPLSEIVGLCLPFSLRKSLGGVLVEPGIEGEGDMGMYWELEEDGGPGCLSIPVVQSQLMIENDSLRSMGLRAYPRPLRSRTDWPNSSCQAASASPWYRRLARLLHDHE